MYIETLKETRDIEQIVNIHMDSFQGFFLTFLGRGFLRQLYRGYIEYPSAGVIIAYEEKGYIEGFLAFSEDLSGLYKYLIRKRLLQFAWFAFLGFLRRPQILLRLLRAFLKPEESRRKENYMELASIGVLPSCAGKGIGSCLISELKRHTDFQRCSYIKLETDAVGNEKVNRFYLSNGFVREREYVTREGRKMNEYRYYLSNEG